MSYEILKGFVLLALNGGLGVVYLNAVGICFWLTLSLLIFHDIVYVVFIYYGLTGIIVSIVNKIIKRVGLDKSIQRYKNNRFSKKKKKFLQKFVDWMTDKGVKITLIIAFVPVFPFIATGTTVAIKWMKIKFGLVILIIATVFRSIIYCLLIYKFFEWIFPWIF